MNYGLNSFYDRLLHNLPLHLHDFMNDWHFNKPINGFFDLDSFNKWFFHSYLHNLHCFLEYWPISNHLNLNWFFYYVSDFHNFLYNFGHFNNSIFHLHNRHNFLNNPINWNLLNDYFVFNLRSRVVDRFFHNNFFYLFNLNHLWNLPNNFLNSLNNDLHRFENFDDFFSRNYFLNLDNHLFYFRHFHNDLFNNFLYFLNLHNSLYDLFHFDNLWNLLYHFHWLFYNLRNFHNLFDKFGDFNQLLDENCFHSWHLHRHISHILHNLHLLHLYRHLDSVFSCYQFWHLNNFLHNLFYHFLNFYNFGYSSINLQNVIYINNIHDLLFD